MFTSAWELLPYSVLAIWMAVLAMVYVRTFYAIKHAFESLRMPKALKPAVGAALAAAWSALAIFFAAGRPEGGPVGALIRLRSASARASR